MTYLGNSIYQVEINGNKIETSLEDLKNKVKEIERYEDKKQDYVDIPKPSYIYDNSAKFTILISDIKDDVYKGIEYSDDLMEIMDRTIDSAYESAKAFYTSNYVLEEK